MHMIAEKIKARRTALIVIFAIAVILSAFIVIEYKDSDYYRFDPDSFILTNAAIEENRIVVSDDIPEDSEVVNTDAFWLTPGAYSVDITYSASGTSLIRLTVDNDQFREYTLDPGGSVLNISFSTTHPTNRAKIQIFAGPESGLVIEDMIMYADHRIYTDAVYHAILLVLALLAALICVIKMPAIRSAKDIPDAFYIIIAIALSTCMFYLVDKGGQIFCIDTRGQMQRIEGVALGLRDRQFPVIIAPNFFNEFGQLEFMYPNLFLYPFGILRLFGVSMSEAYRSYMLLINTLTAVCTYYAGKSMFPKRITYLSVAALYLFMPHRMDVMLDLGAAAGTGIAVAFLPLLISGFYLLLKADRRCIRSLVFGMSGILNSHVVTLILVTGFLSFLFLINIRRLVSDRCSRLLLLCRAAVTTVILNLGFLVIFLGCYMSEWDKKRIQWSDYEGMTLDMTTVPEATYIWLYMLAVVIAAVIWIMMGKKIPDTDRKYMADLLVVCILAFVAASNLIPWTALFSKSDFIRNVFMYIQLPHRFYTLFEPVGLFLFGLMVSHRSVLDKRMVAGAVVPLCVLIIISTTAAIRSYYRNDKVLYDKVCGNITTFDQLDYAPTEFTPDSYRSDSAYLLGDEEALQVMSYSKEGTHIDIEYENISPKQDLYAVFPLTYYEEYTAENGSGDRDQVLKSEDGRVMVKLEEGGPHALHVYYRVKPLYTVVYSLMLVIWTAYLIGCVFMHDLSFGSASGILDIWKRSHMEQGK